MWTPAEIKQSLQDGTLTVTGPGDPVGGKPTIRLRQQTDVTLTPWIDAVTYLPLRWQVEQEDLTPFDVVYLPPTPENLTALRTVIPQDFTEEK